jgi:hypothetical protein
MKIFGLHAPIVADRMFDPAAGRIAEPPCFESGCLGEQVAAELRDDPRRKFIVIFRHRRAAGGVNEPTAARPADTRTQRRHTIRVVIGINVHQIGVRKRERDVSADGKIQVQVFDVAFKAGDPIARLPIISGLHAAAEAEGTGMLPAGGIDERCRERADHPVWTRGYDGIE